MTLDKIQILIEVDDFEFHANQCTRHAHAPDKHARMSQAFDELCRDGFIVHNGDDYVLSSDGDDVLLNVRRSSIDLLKVS